jgi:hypothetical protein
VNLVKALECVLKIRDLETKVINSSPDERIPLVETYINIANAYAFQGNISSALEYLEGGVSMAARIIEILGIKMSTIQMAQEQRDAY